MTGPNPAETFSLGKDRVKMMLNYLGGLVKGTLT